MEVLILTKNEIKELTNMRDVVNAIKEVFKIKATGNIQMPPKSYLHFENYKGDLRVMPSHIPKVEMASVKIVNSHPENPENYNLPTVMALITLIDPKTGSVLSIMEGAHITALRTGAASAVATESLARKDSDILSIVGAGEQALSQLSAVSEVLDLSEVRIYDIAKYKREKFISIAIQEFDYSYVDCQAIANCIKGSDIISTITPVRRPIVSVNWIDEGAHINAIGADAPGKEELDPSILVKSKIVVDDYEQACHGGEINVPLRKGIISEKNIYAELGDILSGRKKGRESDKEITIFDSTGLAIQDNIVASIVYQSARERNRGRWITF